jgi:hypothetical protein
MFTSTRRLTVLSSVCRREHNECFGNIRFESCGMSRPGICHHDCTPAAASIQLTHDMLQEWATTAQADRISTVTNITSISTVRAGLGTVPESQLMTQTPCGLANWCSRPFVCDATDAHCNGHEKVFSNIALCYVRWHTVLAHLCKSLAASWQAEKWFIDRCRRCTMIRYL